MQESSSEAVHSVRGRDLKNNLAFEDKTWKRVRETIEIVRGRLGTGSVEK